MRARTVIAALAATVALAGLTGCAASQPDTAKPTSSTSTAPSVAKTVYDECVDGQATVLASKLTGDFSLEGDCKTVSIVGAAKKGTTITLPALDLLVIEGNATKVTADSAAKIVFAGNDNVVQHGGHAEVEDHGTGNSATER
ncbi:DUF3060 family protein [Curtobacterium sp. PhB130]|uniref:DUF3060 domain-containing protein n=1 Tax=unclassified Curtobacterium TaxID=257496 RepID=UPI000F4C82C6|nr:MULTISPECIES: DUF3060 domain-containing protein [unclassified Curtobacterium]ROP65161.1 DUF3060 family protein [Curtobacterium sp. ZW137]ROS78256.1 DUF3060 family protein [Curtobacterium sp. PhB130]TCK65427.1 DUF3060 family protein [Curtobacterium sp. PhB136]